MSSILSWANLRLWEQASRERGKGKLMMMMIIGDNSSFATFSKAWMGRVVGNLSKTEVVVCRGKEADSLFEVRAMVTRCPVGGQLPRWPVGGWPVEEGR